MNWLQNTIAIIISFLIARILIDSDIHRYYVRHLLKKAANHPGSFFSGILFTSYFFSIFFSNTVVVLSMIPIIKLILEKIHDQDLNRQISTPTVLALIYGANIGGMASLTGSPLNIVYLGFIEINRLPGRENITFFSWLIFGIPATLVMIFIARSVLKLGEKGIDISSSLQISDDTPEVDRARIRKYTLFFIFNMMLLITFTALQFWFKPKPVFEHFNLIDLAMMAYLALFLFFGFIFPRGRHAFIKYPKNLLSLLLFVLFFLPIYIVELGKDIIQRFRLKECHSLRKFEDFILAVFNRIWYVSFKEKQTSLKDKNPHAYVSLSRLVYDLPFFGFFFMGVALFVIYLAVRIGDNPATQVMDGYILRFFHHFSLSFVPTGNQVFVFLLVVVLVAIFFTEIINNTTVVLIMFPMMLNISEMLPFNLLFSSLAITIAASGAFMTPIATPVNAISYASFPHVSLKKMLGLGVIINVMGGLWITLVFYFLGMYLNLN